LLFPYRLYLQKRAMASLKSGEEDEEVKVYQLMNLINAGTSVAPFLFLIGRYFHKKVKVAVLFNVVLAQDISLIYETIVNSVSVPVSNDFLREVERMH